MICRQVAIYMMVGLLEEIVKRDGSVQEDPGDALVRLHVQSVLCDVLWVGSFSSKIDGMGGLLKQRQGVSEVFVWKPKEFGAEKNSPIRYKKNSKFQSLSYIYVYTYVYQKDINSVLKLLLSMYIT